MIYLGFGNPMKGLRLFISLIFPGLRLFGGLRLLSFEIVPKATVIWGATTIRQLRVPALLRPLALVYEKGHHRNLIFIRNLNTFTKYTKFGDMFCVCDLF